MSLGVKKIPHVCVGFFGTPMGNRSERSERNSGACEFTHIVKRQPSVLGFVQRSCVRVNAQ